jgi:hypothetical protein
MSNIESHATPALEKLLQSEPEQLFTELGLRRQAILDDPIYAGSYASTATFDAPFAGPLDTLREIGQRFFERFSPDAYGLICGSDTENADMRKKLLDALNLGETAFAAALVSALVGTIGLAPALASVLAALIVRLFYRNAYSAMCDVWKKNLPQ